VVANLSVAAEKRRAAGRSSGSITSRTRDQQWTLNQTGNWDLDKVDLDGDGSFTGTDEAGVRCAGGYRSGWGCGCDG